MDTVADEHSTSEQCATWIASAASEVYATSPRPSLPSAIEGADTSPMNCLRSIVAVVTAEQGRSTQCATLSDRFKKYAKRPLRSAATQPPLNVMLPGKDASTLEMDAVEHARSWQWRTSRPSWLRPMSPRPSEPIMMDGRSTPPGATRLIVNPGAGGAGAPGGPAGPAGPAAPAGPTGPWA